ncbi:choline-sulfatase [Paraburkholderia dipogonis]|uniref:Choline-sulfatase n=1 Tax=Paraburkholderia dipogonis TaxID=1211383 RepID=A0A4Y8MHI9_9BURK|nr:choline-sulfatase [Paraburkholderia dipogonis]TFE36885.1 choline-sulfatase [Paraburkholderia dipogonis]
MKKPNIVFIMADQMTAYALSAYGNKVTKTPNLDRLAAEGTVFENAYCPYPLCAPSRFALMAGRLPSRIGAYDNAAEFPAAVPTFAHYLRDAGYYTCLSGKMHFVGPDQHHGFEDRLTTEIYPADFSWTPLTYDEVDDPEEPTTHVKTQGVSSVETVADASAVARSLQIDYDDEVARRAVQQIYDWRRYGDGRPLFMTVSFTQPHDPYVSTPEFWDLYKDEDIDAPRVAKIPLEQMDPHSRGLFFHYGLDKFNVTEDVYRRARHGYYAMISYIDKRVGEIRAALEATGMAKDTILMFTSDHGDMVGERGLWFKKNLFNPALSVPLLYFDPRKQGLNRVKAPVSLVDVLPTLVDIATGSEDAIVTPFEGSSLLPLMCEDEPERVVLAEHLDGGTKAPRVMVRKGDYKLVYSKAYPPQLYNLADDPGERLNLAENPDYRAVFEELKRILSKTWDLGHLRDEVVASQRTRQFLLRALQKGKVMDWETYPNAIREHTKFVRRGEYFPEVEQRSYLRLPDSD